MILKVSMLLLRAYLQDYLKFTIFCFEFCKYIIINHVTYGYWLSLTPQKYGVHNLKNFYSKKEGIQSPREKFSVSIFSATHYTWIRRFMPFITASTEAIIISVLAPLAVIIFPFLESFTLTSTRASVPPVMEST